MNLRKFLAPTRQKIITAVGISFLSGIAVFMAATFIGGPPPSWDEQYLWQPLQHILLAPWFLIYYSTTPTLGYWFNHGLWLPTLILTLFYQYVLACIPYYYYHRTVLRKKTGRNKSHLKHTELISVYA